MKDYLAQRENVVGDLTPGNVGINDAGDPTGTLTRLLSTIIGFLTVIAAIYFMFMIITGAVGIISSGGDKGAYEDARKRITMGAVGFVITIAAIFIMRLVALFLGVPDILNLTNMVEQIRL